MRVAGMSLVALLGLGSCDNSTVAICWGDAQFCDVVAVPIADAGPDQNAIGGEAVVLDGSDSRAGVGTIRSYAWTQTAGPGVALVGANQAKASFVAPDVAADQVLTFRLTVIDSANVGDTNDTNVAVAPAPVMVALRLLDGSLRPPAPWPQNTDECPSATDGLPADAAAAQLGLWLAARTLALVKGLDPDDPSQWLDFVRLLIAERSAATADTSGQLETFGFVLFASALGERDPALQQAIGARLAGARMLDDPAALVASRTRVRAGPRIRIEPTADRTAALYEARERLLAARSGCVAPAAALELTAAGFAVIAAAE